jgi:hypothetical protein
MNTTKEIIMPESELAAKPITFEGWVSRNGKVYKIEGAARLDGCTHNYCECGKVKERFRSFCDECNAKRTQNNYLKLPFKEWDGKTMLCIYHDDQFFHSEDDIFDYCDEHDCKSEDLELVICEPNYYRIIQDDYWEDEAPEDWEPPKELNELIGKLNEYCESHIISWSAGKFRTTVKLESENDSL